MTQEKTVSPLTAPFKARESLQLSFIASLGGLLLLSAAVVAAVAGTLLYGRTATREAAHQQEAAGRIAAEIAGRLDRVEALATRLAALVTRDLGNPDSLRQLVQSALETDPTAALAAAIGVWPETGTGRGTVLLLHAQGGKFSFVPGAGGNNREPYFREAWYTPVRYLPNAGRCYWTPAYQDRLSKQNVVTCAAPIRSSGAVAGVVTVSLPVSQLDALLEAASPDPSRQALLFDRMHQLLAHSRNALPAGTPEPRNAAELAKNLPMYRPLALALFDLGKQRQARAGLNGPGRAADLAQLQSDTPSLSQDEARATLAVALGTDDAPAVEPIPFTVTAGGALLKRDLPAFVVLLPESDLRLFLAPAVDAAAPAWSTLELALAAIAATAAAALLLAAWLLHLRVAAPLRRMAHYLTAATTPEVAVQPLDASKRDEIGTLAYLVNERFGQIRELLDQVDMLKSRLATEGSQHRESSERLTQAENRMTQALEAVDDAVVITDAHGRIDYMNQAAQALFGVRAPDARRLPLESVARIAVAADRKLLPNLATIALQRQTRLNYSDHIVLLSDERAPQDVAVQVLPYGRPEEPPKGAVVVVRRREAKVAAETAVRERRQTDAVTGLPTRPALLRHLRGLLDQARLMTRTHALVCLDIDRLGEINGLLGNNAGDEALAWLTRIAQDLMGSALEAFRLPGGRLAIVLPDSDEPNAVRQAETLRQGVLERPFLWASQSHSITVSVGVTLFDGSDLHPSLALDRALDACRSAKREGRNRVRTFAASTTWRHGVAEDRVWVSRIHRGLERGLLHLATQWIQPASTIVREGEVYEITLSLEDEEGFWAAPTQFMPAAERHQLGAELDRWALRETLARLKRDPGIAHRLAYFGFTVSGNTLEDPEMLDFIAQALGNGAVAPQKICFQLREESLSEMPAEADRFANTVRSMGCPVALDGYIGRRLSDIETLKRFPVDFVRLDSRYFPNVTSTGAIRTIADGVLRISHALRRRVIVTQLDEPAALDAWRDLGSDYFQGNAVARSSPIVFSKVQ